MCPDFATCLMLYICHTVFGAPVPVTAVGCKDLWLWPAARLTEILGPTLQERSCNNNIRLVGIGGPQALVEKLWRPLLPLLSFMYGKVFQATIYN